MDWLWDILRAVWAWAQGPGFLWRVVEGFMLAVGVIYVYWSMYSIHRMRRSLHEIRNWLQKVYIEQLRAERDRTDAVAAAKRPGTD